MSKKLKGIVQEALDYFRLNPKATRWEYHWFLDDPKDEREIGTKTAELTYVWNKLQEHGCWLRVDGRGAKETILRVYRNKDHYRSGGG